MEKGAKCFREVESSKWNNSNFLTKRVEGNSLRERGRRRGKVNRKAEGRKRDKGREKA